jgi:hypothetical protein
VNRAEKKAAEERARRLQDAYDASGSFYSATLHAPPHPHTLVGLVAGRERETVMEAVVSMQADARALGADGVLGVSVCPMVYPWGSRFVAYGTAVKWAQPAEEE